MNVELIKVDPQVARTKLTAYRKAIAARHHTEAGRRASVEYEKIAAGYEAAAKGLPLIELSKAMRGGIKTAVLQVVAAFEAVAKELRDECK